MDAEMEPRTEEVADSDPARAPGATQASAGRSDADLERDVKAATRNGRYALITALCAAVVSSAVAAGSAIYNTHSELDRNENVAAAQVLRADRQKTYVDFYNAAYSALATFGGLKAALMLDPPDRELVRRAAVEVNERMQEAAREIGSVYLVGSEEVSPTVARFAKSMNAFIYDHLKPFPDQDATTADGVGGADKVAMLIDDPTLVGEIDRCTEELQTSFAEFVVVARDDLGAG